MHRKSGSRYMTFPDDPSQYQLICLIGKGASSEVYQARCLSNGRELAIKLINLEIYPLDLDFLRQEVAFWSTSQHDNIVGYYGSFVAGPHLYILMEFLSGGSVYDIMRYKFKTGFHDEMIIATILRSITEALSHIHQNGQIHRDIKPGNAIIGEDGSLKIGDFGVAATLVEQGQRKRARYTQIGTPCYMAPEVLKGAGHTEKADIWSLGITAIELGTGSAPYADLAELAIVQKILNAPPPHLPRDRDFSPEYRDFVRKCLIYNPSRRPSAADLLKHPFMERASDPSYIVDYVLKDLPPIGDRYEKMQSALTEWGDELELQLASEIGHAASQDILELPGSAPCKIQWSFFDEDDKPQLSVKQKGRFTIKRSSKSQKDVGTILDTIPELPTETGSSEVELEKPTDLEGRVDILAGEVQELTREMKMMREQIQSLTKLLSQSG